jgi:predicted transcriptional regulator
MSESVFQLYSKDYLEDLKNMLTLENVKFFVYSEELKIANLTVTNRFFMISLFPKNQKHFDRESLINYEPSAIKFGNEFFDELLKNSTQITQKPNE